MATRAVLTPFSARVPVEQLPALTLVNARVLAYDASTQETAYWTLVVPARELTGALSVVLSLIRNAAGTKLRQYWEVAVKAVTSAGLRDGPGQLTTSCDPVNTRTWPCLPLRTHRCRCR